MWAATESWISYCRDVLGFRCAAHEPYAHWETLARLSGFRFMHAKFAMVCDFPTHIQREMHREDGPTHQWSDGFSIWHINGVRVDEQIVMRPETQTLKQIRDETNEEVKRVRIERYGWGRYLRDAEARTVHRRRNDVDGTTEALMRCDGHTVLVCACRSTARVYALEVPEEIQTCEQAQSWITGDVVGSGMCLGAS